MKNLTLLILSLFVFSSAAIAQEKIRIAVAANAQYAMKAIEKQYEKETGKDVELIIGSSGKLTAQIREGAPFDVFLSADMEYPEQLQKEGLTLGEPKIYAYGTLVFWSTREFEPLNSNTLLLMDVKNIAIANPKTAPYGAAAINALKYYKIYDKVESKLVYGESISQVNQYITSKSADVGITAKSVVVSPEMQGKGKWVELNKKSYEPIAQGAVILKSAATRNQREAEQFYNYLYSKNGQSIFKK